MFNIQALAKNYRGCGYIDSTPILCTSGINIKLHGGPCQKTLNYRVQMVIVINYILGMHTYRYCFVHEL